LAVLDQFAFLQGLDRDIQKSLLLQLRDLWTHTSTAIEGNTLTLGDTNFVLEEGLTVSGKSIKDHQEVIGHAKAIELMYSMVGRGVTEKDIFSLHKAIQTELVTDIYKPAGAWKIEPNGTYAVLEGRQEYIEYAAPSDVEKLMVSILSELNSYVDMQEPERLTMESAAETYAKIHMGFVHIHPFWDGNGRMARLLANLPLLNSGLPPLVISKENRKPYIEILANYQMEIGVITPEVGIWPEEKKLQGFISYCEKEYSHTKRLVQSAIAQQASRQ